MVRNIKNKEIYKKLREKGYTPYEIEAIMFNL
jgi:hypothetical protein